MPGPIPSGAADRMRAAQPTFDALAADANRPRS
jgi:hypothetical protein